MATFGPFDVQGITGILRPPIGVGGAAKAPVSQIVTATKCASPAEAVGLGVQHYAAVGSVITFDGTLAFIADCSPVYKAVKGEGSAVLETTWSVVADPGWDPETWAALNAEITALGVVTP